MAQRLDPLDPRIGWYGAISYERGDGWVRPWRIPIEHRALFGRPVADDRMLARAGMPSGVRMAFHTTSTTLACGVEPLDPGDERVEASRVDIWCNGQLHASLPLQDASRVITLPEGEKLVEVWLPHYCECRVRNIEIDEGVAIRPFIDVRPRWLVYGSSNTQCRFADSPSATWPAIVARTKGLNLTNLGYGSECHLDPMIAIMMRDLPAELIAMEIGINIYIDSTLNARSLRSSFVGFIQILREGHPSTPISVLSSIYSFHRETTPNAAGLTLPSIRAELAAAIDDLREAGDPNLAHVNGLQLFGPDMADYLPDKLHPNTAGYALLAERLANHPLFIPSPPARA